MAQKVEIHKRDPFVCGTLSIRSSWCEKRRFMGDRRLSDASRLFRGEAGLKQSYRGWRRGGGDLPRRGFGGGVWWRRGRGER